MGQGSQLPALDWPTLLRHAPYFGAAVVDALCDADPDDFAPHVRAVYYFDLFDAQVSNGGVDQYFDNVASRLPNAADVPEIIATNPVYAPALSLIEEAHGVWNDVASAYPDDGDDDVEDADTEDDWGVYHDRLAAHSTRLEAIGDAFFAIHHTIRRAVEADIISDPRRYFSIADPPGLRGSGIEHVTLADGAHRLRFEDGFPVGPNIFDTADGDCDVVWFSRDRELMQCETSGYGSGRSRHWIHYPSQASGSWSIDVDLGGDEQTIRKDRIALGTGHHGLYEVFTGGGQRETASLHWYGEEMCSEYFYPDGTPLLRCRRGDRGEHRMRFWPNGAINTESIRERDGRERYLRCLDADGHDLAPNGSGRLMEMLSLDAEMCQWLEGELVGGFLNGEVRRMASHPDGSAPRETELKLYTNGRAR